MAGPARVSDQSAPSPAGDHSAGLDVTALSNEDFANHQATMASKERAATNNGKAVLPPIELAKEINTAIASGNKDQLAHAEQDLSDAANAAFVSSKGDKSSLSTLQDAVNANISPGHAVEAEAKVNGIHTHIDTKVGNSQAERDAHPMARYNERLGLVDDMTDPISSKLPPELQEVRHVLKPEDSKLTASLAEKQANNLSLSPEVEKRLETALNLVSNVDSSSDAVRQQLGQMMPELANPASNLGQAFNNALKELGYQTTFQASGDGSYHMDLQEPKPQGIGGGKISVNYAPPSGSETQPQVDVQHYFYKGF